MLVTQYAEPISVVDCVNNLITHAVQRSASDIHLEQTRSGLRVRYRIDGVLYDQPSIESKYALQILSRIKILAHIDIAEHRVPHDGKFRMQVNNHDIDLRVSTFPAAVGPKIVIRILDRSVQKITLDSLGLSEQLLSELKQLLSRQSGFFLVTGPTGSGKTTTLYGALSFLHAPQKHIITLEDPVEYHIEGITQGQIHPEAGFTFERGIRALLRQDPDIAMVGEIRDKQTARIAIEAALTGHLVLSTLHTNDAPSAVMRLMDMGIEPFLINASLTGVLAQRLVRLICTSCRYERKVTEQEKPLLEKLQIKTDMLWEGRGCASCFHLGYKQRTGIFEFLIMNNALRALIVQNPVCEAIWRQAQIDGMKTLQEDAISKLRQGKISLSELLRIL